MKKLALFGGSNCIAFDSLGSVFAHSLYAKQIQQIGTTYYASWKRFRMDIVSKKCLITPAREMNKCRKWVKRIKRPKKKRQNKVAMDLCELCKVGTNEIPPTFLAAFNSLTFYS